MTIDFTKVDAVWIYGTGTFAREVISQLAQLGISTLGVVDHRGVGDLFETKEGTYSILEPSIQNLEPGQLIVLAVCNLHGDLHSISSNLFQVEKNLQIITPVQLFRFFSEKGIKWDNYWLTTDSGVLKRHAAEIENFQSNLADDESLNLLSAILKYRENGLVSDLPIPYPLSEQYLADDLRTPPLNLNIIDLGACQGENLEYFIEAGRIFDAGYLLEPDRHNFALLKSKVSELNLSSLNCLQLGAWEKSTILKFDASGNPSASFSDIGMVEIKVVAMDDFIPENFHTNFIKMDIEGAELSALKGMVQVIKRDYPHLAISAYHKPQDLWEIGNFLSSTFPNVFKYYLRMYGHQTFDTILYAIPR